MPAPKGNTNAVGNRGGRGGQSKYRPEFAEQAKKATDAGFTDREIAELFGVDESTVNRWKFAHVEFAQALKVGKEPADERVESSLYRRALGYSHDAVKIFQYQGQEVVVPYVEHVPPDTTACIFWLKNRRPDLWRDRVVNEHTGKDGGPIKTEDTSLLEAGRRIAFLLSQAANSGAEK